MVGFAHRHSKREVLLQISLDIDVHLVFGREFASAIQYSHSKLHLEFQIPGRNIVMTIDNKRHCREHGVNDMFKREKHVVF